jgi:uncharacterized membrane protein YhaH (DUF805 family)
MKNQFKIGRGKENEIVVQDKECPILHAEINYDKGNWLLNNLVKDKSVFVNGKKIEGPKELGKNDKIKIGKETFYWSNYLYEGENQELDLKEIFTYNGRISRSNFRALSLLAIGMIICVFFSPGLLGAIGQGRRGNPEMFEAITQNSAPIIYIIGFSIIGIAMILLAIKRIRDTGNPIWKLWIPIYNFKILYFEESKK